MLAPYRALGHTGARRASRKDPAFIETVRTLIGGRVAILAGHSGVGKSTITSALTGVPRAVGAVSEKVRTGRHTTSDPRLIPLPGGGAVVDTAGVRTFHLPADGPRDARVGLPRHRARGRPAAASGGARTTATPAARWSARCREQRLESYRRMLADMR